MSDEILVLGATGKAGRRIVPRLRLSGVHVRAASRSGDTRFDWSRPEAWTPALRGVSAVYVVPPAVPGPVHDLLAQAAAAGVQRVVLQSGRRADDWGDVDFGADMLDAERAVRGSDLEWTVLRPSNFMQNFSEELWHAPLERGELSLPAGPVPEPFVDLEDVADVAVAALVGQGHAEHTYELTGPRAVLFSEAVALISRASGLPMTYREVSTSDYAAALVAHGLDHDAAHHVSEMFVMMQRGITATTTDDVAAVLGRPARTFEDYVLRSVAGGAWQR